MCRGSGSNVGGYKQENNSNVEFYCKFERSISVKVIRNWQHKEFRCHFCGKTRSVKYTVTVNDPTVDDKPTEVYCCNKCALMQIGKS